jgi:formylglycine-generating enzyme required for sulfatase activity
MTTLRPTTPFCRLTWARAGGGRSFCWRSATWPMMTATPKQPGGCCVKLPDRGATRPGNSLPTAWPPAACCSCGGRRHHPSWANPEASRLAGQLYHRLYAEPALAPAPIRQEAGLALGLLYNDDPLPDPRFGGPLGLPAFVAIPAGFFVMGTPPDEATALAKGAGKEEDFFARETPPHRVWLDGYELARYPTTNAMFARFIADGGYNNPAYWPEAIAADRWQDGKIRDWIDNERTQPEYWRDGRFNNPAQPVVGVTWYEAEAYCRWLTDTLADGYSYRLPAEAEWERAARLGSRPSPAGPESGDKERHAYPWGDGWQPEHCNSKDAILETTSPVGLFPAGAAPGPLHDMAGNVLEWCRDWYDSDYYSRSPEQNPPGPETGNGRVLRGGSWAQEHVFCRCGCRYRSDPRHQAQLRGISLRQNSLLSLVHCPLSVVPCSWPVRTDQSCAAATGDENRFNPHPSPSATPSPDSGDAKRLLHQGWGGGVFSREALSNDSAH